MAIARVKPQKNKYSSLQSAPSFQITNVTMTSQDIDKWRRAIDGARSARNPRRRDLIDMFEIIKIDGQVEAVMDKRRVGITNKRINFTMPEGVDIPELIIDKVLNAPWFYDLRGHAIDARFYGFSFMEFMFGSDGLIEETILLPRQNCFPEYQFFAYSSGTATPDYSNGVYLESDPSYKNLTMICGGRKEYGKLMTMAQYVIYKRGSFGDWTQFAELFGMPFRVGEYDPYDDDMRKKLADGLEKAGGAGYAVIPKGSNINFHDTNASGKSDIFDFLIDRCNKEISKIGLGATMTLDDGASRSQGQVHQDGQTDITISDMIEMEYLLNWKLKPKLEAQGYPINGGKFGYPEANKLPQDKLIDVIMKLATIIDIDPEYIYRTFGVERPKEGVEPIRINKPAVDAGPPIEPTKKVEKKKSPITLSKQLDLIYSDVQFTKHTLKLSQVNDDPIWDRISREIHEGKLKPGMIDPELLKWTAEQLTEGVLNGYGSIVDYPVDSAKAETLSYLKENVQVFSGFKTHATLREATDLLTHGNGEVKSFARFKKDILAINNKYNVTYLQAEYSQAVAASQMASKWQDFEDNKDVSPTLTYRTAGDDRVRPSHAALDGITRKVDDSFWNTHYPPCDWGCRCDVEPSDMEETPLPSDLGKQKEMFKVNWGKQKIVFPEDHPYYKVSIKEAAKIKEQTKKAFRK